jgi:hypothetical protein
MSAEGSNQVRHGDRKPRKNEAIEAAKTIADT